MRTFTIKTEASTRSKTRRSRTWNIDAEDQDDAIYQARMNHLAVVGWNTTIWVTEIKSDHVCTYACADSMDFPHE